MIGVMVRYGNGTIETVSANLNKRVTIRQLGYQRGGIRQITPSVNLKLNPSYLVFDYKVSNN